MRKPKRLQSAVIYRGPSLIDGGPIVVVAIISGRNKKTGKMVQTYILREDVDPRLASKLGLDFSICGNCPMRGTPTTKPEAKQAEGRACYVFLGQGPLIVWQSLQAGIYPVYNDLEGFAEGLMVRLGTYGDGAAVPSEVWHSLLRRARGFTGYSHQSGFASAAFDPSLYMASVETLPQARAQWDRGARTFRIVESVGEVDKSREVLCPASKEAGKRTSCADCGLCAGNTVKAKSIAIVAHGAGRKHFEAA
jgi:hypothetical protein